VIGPFVPVGWSLPTPLDGVAFRLEPLGPAHNESDHRAWVTSIEHIRGTPGFSAGDWGDDSWPLPMSLDDNLADLRQHAREFDQRQAFAYSVIDPVSGEVIGCVYIDPDESGIAVAKVRCWVCAGRAELDTVVAFEVAVWLAGAWPFGSVRFPGRGDPRVGLPQER
jgi:hypothetical protein